MIPRPATATEGEPSSGLAAFALAHARLAPEDEERSRWLAARCFRREDPDEATEPVPAVKEPKTEREVCQFGHPIDGVKGHGKNRRRYCKTCRAANVRAQRAKARRR